MANRPAKATQAEIARVLKAARDAGLPVARWEVAPDGTIRVYTTPDASAAAANDWDRTTA